MIGLTRTVARLAAGLIVVILALGASAYAGDYHQGSGLHCSDCHVMHGSKDGTLYGGGNGIGGLIKFSSTNALCLSCHDGTDTTAPDVVASGTAAAPNDTLSDAYASAYKNSAGFYQSDHGSAASNAAHNLGGGSVTAVQGTWSSGGTGMDCADCHNPHGTSNYRNLKGDPGGAGTNVNVRTGTEVFLREPITIPATKTATETHYDTSAVGFDDQNNVVAWCVSCHTNITTGNKHVQNQAISGADGSHWTSGTGIGFGTGVGDGTAGIPRLRFGQNGTTYATTTTVATSNTVFCLSCHKAHGSKHDSTVVWPHYTSGDADQTSACGQCHNSGG